MIYLSSGCLLLLETVILDNVGVFYIYLQDVCNKLLNIMVFFWRKNGPEFPKL